jgi:hypothetical protein
LIDGIAHARARVVAHLRRVTLVTDSSTQSRYRQDTNVAAAIGRAVAGQLPSTTVRIPVELADQAVRAWHRDEQEVAPETDEHRIMRGFAAALALIGLAVEERGERDGTDVTVTLAADQIAACVFAADLQA